MSIKIQRESSGTISAGKKVLKIVLTIAIVGVVFLISGLLVLFILINNYLSDLPELNINDLKNVSQTSYIYDANGNVIADYRDTEDRTWVSIENMPKDLLDAVVSVEDRRFYSHGGYDVKRLLGAVVSVVLHKDVYGGSTLTQQLIKNTVLSNEVTLKRKVQEIALAMELEEKMTKDEILEAYLNVIYLGGSNYGVAAAAKDYFGKDDLMQLTKKECAFLAGITQNPWRFDPRANYYERDAFDRNEKRTSDVLYAMQVCGHITEEEYYEIMAEEIVIKEESSSLNMYKYPHFVEYAVSDVINGFIEYRGLEDTKENRTAIENEIRTKGYRIYTTIDPKVQEAVQSSLSEFVYPKFQPDPERPDIETTAQAASVVIDQKTGAVVAMVGSVDEPVIKKSYNRAISSKMPIGSIIKPIGVYAPAVEEGLSPATPVCNIPSKIYGYDGDEPYPGGGLDTIGIVSTRCSLEHSLNIPTARILCYRLGFGKSTEYLTSLGVDRDTISETGSGLALGSSGINMLDVTGAYATIANGGVYKEPRAYTQVLDPSGKVILNAESVKSSHRVFSEATSYIVSDMMKGVITQGTGTAAKLNGITAAGKTGTNEDNSLTFAGFTRYYTSALWVGNDYFLPFETEVSSGDVVAPLWKIYMDKIHVGLEDKEVIDVSPESAGLVKATVCNVSGKLAGEFCSHGTTEDWFISQFVPTEECDNHISVDLCSESHGSFTENCPSSVKGTFTKLYIPEDSYLFTIERDKITELFGEVIWGEEELQKEIAANRCYYHDPSYIPEPNSDEGTDNIEDTEALEE